MILKLAIVCLAITSVFSSEEHKANYPPDSVPPPEVYAHSTARTNRLVHNFFHHIRMNFPLLDEIEQRQIENLGWKPTFISYAFRRNGTEVYVNGTTGEDFLYMHDKMIRAVNKIAEDANSNWRVVGWTECPSPNDPVWPVPPIPDEIVNDIPDYAAYLEPFKSDDFYNDVIVKGQEYLNDYDNLRGLTLGELGVKLEYELHTYFHVRFSGYNPIGYRNPGPHPTEHVDPKYDHEDYDYLADFYSAHVNPHFWKIHGWVDLHIKKWMVANLIGTITDPNTDPTTVDTAELTWISTWEHGPLELIEELFQVAADGADRARNGVEGDGHDAGVIVGSVMGGLALGMLIALIGFVCMLKIKSKNNAKGQAKQPVATHESKPLNA